MRIGRIRLGLCALVALLLSLPGCTPEEQQLYSQLPAPAASAAVLVAAPPPPPPPPPEHCADYDNMEAGRGHPVNQDWFNHLDARGYAQVRSACVYGWGGAQFACLDRLWSGESHWNHKIWNKGGSGAYGIPQSLPARKMASFGADFMTNPRVQVRWGLDYIFNRYRTPGGTGCHGPY